MMRTLHHPVLRGAVTPPPSKSQAHRLLICAALSREPTTLICPALSVDLRATIRCLNAMGAKIDSVDGKINIIPIQKFPEKAFCDCGESGSTLRFLLPVAAALGLESTFVMGGRLPQRPMAELEKALTEHGAEIRRDENKIEVKGRLSGGDFVIPGNISSQYISGLELALPLLNEPSRIEITGSIESAPYIDMTEDALRTSGVDIISEERRKIICPSTYALHGTREIEADWSAAAFWITAGVLGKHNYIELLGLNKNSRQGDKRIVDIINKMGGNICFENGVWIAKSSQLHGMDIDASQIPDLVPVLSIAAAAADGDTRIFHAKRLKNKESDRLLSIYTMLKDLGADAELFDDGFIIKGKPELKGGVVNSFGDHRIVMSAAAASVVCRDMVNIISSETVEKSYKDFWRDFERLT